MNLALIISFLLLLSGGVSYAVEVECSDPGLRRMAQRYLQQRLPAKPSLEQLRQATNIIAARGGLKQIQILEDNTPESGEVQYTLKLTPSLQVNRIRIRNNHAYATSTLLNVLHYSAEALIYLEETEVYQKALTEYYKQAGFPNISMDIQVVPRDGLLVDVEIILNEGSPALLHDVQLLGTYAPLSREAILRRLRAKLGQRYDANELRQRLEKIRLAFVDVGYLSAQVSLDSMLLDEKLLTNQLILRIERGPKIEISYLTNKYFFLDRDRVLAKVIGVDDETKFSKGYLEEAVDKLKLYYQQQGFPHATVSFSDQTSGDGEIRRIAFNIERHERVKIRRIDFVGESALSRSKLQSLLPELAVHDPYDAQSIKTALHNLQTRLQQIGYHEADEATYEENYSSDNRYVDLSINVNTGKLYYFGKTAITTDIDAKSLRFPSLLSYKPHQPFILAQLETSLNRIRNHCRNQGYKFCEVTPSLAPPTDDSYRDVSIQIQLGAKVSMGEVIVQGARLTKDNVIRRELKFDSGEPYSPEHIENSQRAVQRLGFFSGVQFEELHYDESSQQLDYLIKVREKKRRSVRFRLGYGTDEGARLANDLSFLNIGGTGRNAYLSTGVSRRFPGEILQWRIINNYIEPHILHLPVNGRLQFSFQRDEEEFGNLDRLGFFAGLEYNHQTWIQNLFKWEFESRRPFDLKVLASELSDFDQSQRFFGSLGNALTLDLRDNPFNPTRGYLGQLSTNIYAESLLSEEEFYQVFSRNSFYLPLYKQVSLVASLRFGFAATFGSTAAAGSESIPIEKRFRIGGAQSLRGFSLDSVGGQGENEPAASNAEPAPGGNSVINYLIELGVPLPWGFRLVGFTDGGNAFTTNEDIDLSQIRTSAGFGIRYVTPIGPLRLDFGFKLDRRPTESLGELHFAVGLF